MCYKKHTNSKLYNNILQKDFPITSRMMTALQLVSTRTRFLLVENYFYRNVS